MARIRLFTLALFALGLGVLAARAQDDDLKNVIRKAIKAHGGEEKLAGMKAVVSKFKGTMTLLNAKRDIDGETSFDKPNRLRNSLKIDFNGKEITVVTVYDGKKFWVSTNGTTMEINDEKTLDEVRQSLLTEGGGGFLEVLKAPYELNAAGEVKVKGQDAIGVRVSKKGQRDITFYFDKKSSLLVKTETRSFDPQKQQEVTQEKFIMGYQEKQGMKVASKLEIHKDGEFFLEANITDLQIFPKLDDSVFAKP